VASKTSWPVAIEAEDHAGVDHDAAPVDLVDGVAEGFGPVLALLAAEKVVRVDGLEADEERAAAAAGHQVEQVRVVADVGGDGGMPGQAEGAEREEELAGAGGRADEVVVDEHDMVGAERFDFAQDLRHGLGAVAGVEVGGGVVAEVAAPGAAAPGGDGVGEEVVLVAQEIPAGDGDAGGIDGAGGLVAGAEGAGLRVAHHLLPKRLGLADDHGVGMGRAIVRAGGGMDAAQDDGDAARAVAGGDGAGARKGVGLDGDPDQVGGFVRAGALDIFVFQGDAMGVRGKGGEHQQGERRRHAGFPFGIHGPARHARGDQFDPQRAGRGRGRDGMGRWKDHGGGYWPVGRRASQP
jgi:hypothetical protein